VVVTNENFTLTFLKRRNLNFDMRCFAQVSITAPHRPRRWIQGLNLVTLRKKEARAAGLTAQDYVVVALGITNDNKAVAVLACPAGSIADINYDVLLQIDLLCILVSTTLHDHDRLNAARGVISRGKRLVYQRLVAARTKNASRKREDEKTGVETDTEADAHPESDSSQPATDVPEGVDESPSRTIRSRTQQTHVHSGRSTRRNDRTPTRRAQATPASRKRKMSLGRKPHATRAASGARGDTQVSFRVHCYRFGP
jgi:hypothetical protein